MLVPVKLAGDVRHKVALSIDTFHTHTHKTDVSDFDTVLHIVKGHSCKVGSGERE
jgi:hypothetical protein